MSLLSADNDLARNSYYAATVQRTQHYPALQSQVDCDVAVVGGGLAGLSAAIELADRGYRVVLLEAREIGSGASGRNGGQAIVGLACEQSTIEEQLGLDEARRVWGMTLEALDLIRQRCERFDIDCEWRSGYLSLAVTERKARDLRIWFEHMQATYGYEAEWIESKDMPKWIDSPRFHSGTHESRSGHLHPLKYSLGLARAAASLGVQVFENSAVTQLIPRRCHPLAHRHRRSPRLACAAGGQRVPAGSCTANREPDHAGRHLHRCFGPHGCGARAVARALGLGGVRHQLRARLLQADC